VSWFSARLALKFSCTSDPQLLKKKSLGAGRGGSGFDTITKETSQYVSNEQKNPEELLKRKIY